MTLKSVLFSLVFLLLSFDVFAGETVEFKMDEFGRVLVPVDAEGGERRFFQFDTASGRSAIFNVNSGLYGVKFYDGNIRHKGSGGFFRVRAGSIKQLSIAGMKRQNHIVAVYPYRSHITPSAVGVVSGSMGFDAFRGVIVHIKPEDQTMQLFANSGYLDRSQWDLVSGYPSSNASILTDFSYQGHKLTVLFATGYSRSVINYSAFNKLYSDRKPNKLKHKKYVARGLDADEKRYGAIILDNVDINGWYLGDIEVAVAPIASGSLTDIRDMPLLILGADILMSQELAFDFRDFQLWYPSSNRDIMDASITGSKK